MLIRVALTCIWLSFSTAFAASFYVDPSGDDTRDGASPSSAWRTVGKVNTTNFKPGDQILFLRGGEWRDALRPRSSGAAGKPIVFDAYGSGRKPKFWGSDVLAADKWKSEGGNVYVYAGLPTVTQVLANHGTERDGRWFANCNGRAIANSPNQFDFRKGELRINSSSDPRSDCRVYTAVVREDVVSSNGKDCLVFRNLVGDETADPAEGYVFRVMGSQDVLMEDCEAYRGGRHNFGVINSTDVVGHRLKTAYAMPNISGGATFYVTYSGDESKHDKCTCLWIDCVGEHFENGSGGAYQYFVCHGARQGPITFQNPIDHGGKFSVLQDTPAQTVSITGGLVEDADLELFCSHATIDGVTLTGNSTVDCWGCDNVFQNLKVTPKLIEGGPTGYRTGVLMREKAQRNTLRFSTIVLDPSASPETSCLMMLNNGLGTQWYGNIMMTNGRAVFSNLSLNPKEVQACDYNLFSSKATINDSPLERWKALNVSDAHSLSGDPKFTNAAGGDYTLQAGSPAIHAAALNGEQVPHMDFNLKPRPSGAADIGAFQK